jgi:Ca-activated chloride channel family protein
VGGPTLFGLPLLGDFNVGTVTTEELVSFIEKRRQEKISLTTIGVGTGNINEAMMEQLANKGDGNYFYLDTFKEARKVFSKELAGTLETIAKDVKLQVEFNPAHVSSYRLIGYENRKLRNIEFSNDAVDAGEIGAGHTVTALYELVLTGSSLANELTTQYRYQRAEEQKAQVSNTELAAELGFVKIRYKDPGTSRSKLLEFSMLRSAVQKDWTTSSDDFRFAAAVSGFAHLLRGSQYTGSTSYTDIEQLAGGSLGADKNGYRREFVELVWNVQSANLP